MAAHLESVRRALAQQDAEVDRFKAIIQENSALNERILEHEDTIARQAAELSTLRSEADDTMTARAAQTAARRLEQQNASLQREELRNDQLMLGDIENKKRVETRDEAASALLAEEVHLKEARTVLI